MKGELNQGENADFFVFRTISPGSPRATTDRYWYAALGQPLAGGAIQLWGAVVLTMVSLIALAASLVLLVTNH